MKSNMKLGVATVIVLALTSCGPKGYVKGDYDKDVEKENLLNDKWSETDMQVAVKELVDSLVGHPSVGAAAKPPLVVITKLQNKTSEHIDTESVMDMIRVELSKRGRVQFVDKQAREDIDDEYQYQTSGRVSSETMKGPGKQVGADYIINGRLDSIVQEAGKDKTIYYKLTLNMTNLATSVISWTDHKQIRKKYKLKSLGI